MLTDTFAAGSGNWSPIAGSWSLVTDGTQRYQSVSSASGISLSVAGLSSWSNYGASVVAKVTAQSRVNGGPGVFLRYQNTSNYYRLNWTRSTSRWEIVRNQGGVLTTVATSSVTSLPVNTDLTLLAEAVGSTLRLSVNGVVVATGTDATFATGRVGLSSFASTVRFDDVVVTAR